MRRRPRLLVLSVVLGLAVAGCGTGNEDIARIISEPIPTDDGSSAPGTDGQSGGDTGGSTDGSGSGAGGDTGSGSGSDGGSTGGAGDVTAALDIDPRRFVPEPIDWEPYRQGVDVGLLTVPIDYADPDGPTMDLFIARRNADDPGRRIGSLLVNPGGPGFGGSIFAIFGDQIYDAELLRHFDIIGWDPRGTGESEPAIDCIDDWDEYAAAIDVADDLAAANVEIAQRFAAECERRNADIISFVGTNNSARDMDTIRRALGEDTISYFGFSYGSTLGAVWATLFPDTVRAAVLDGASDPEADRLESSLQQIAGFEESLSTFLARCSARPSCAFHNGGDAEGAYDRLMEDLEANPVPSRPGRPMVGRSVATTGVIQAMYSESFWPQLERALAAADGGDGAGLLELFDRYYQRNPDGSFGNELEAFQVISCADRPERPTAEELSAETARFHEVAPRLVPADSEPGFFCTFMPPALDPRATVTGDGAGPIVVIGTTGDPATPFESTRRMAQTLEDGRFVIVEADQHTGYGVNRCIVEVVNRYLVDLAPPADGTECR